MQPTDTSRRIIFFIAVGLVVNMGVALWLEKPIEKGPVKKWTGLRRTHYTCRRGRNKQNEIVRWISFDQKKSSRLILEKINKHFNSCSAFWRRTSELQSKNFLFSNSSCFFRRLKTKEITCRKMGLKKKRMESVTLRIQMRPRQNVMFNVVVVLSIHLVGANAADSSRTPRVIHSRAHKKKQIHSCFERCKKLQQIKGSNHYYYRTANTFELLLHFERAISLNLSRISLGENIEWGLSSDVLQAKLTSFRNKKNSLREVFLSFVRKNINFSQFLFFLIVGAVEKSNRWQSMVRISNDTIN